MSTLPTPDGDDAPHEGTAPRRPRVVWVDDAVFVRRAMAAALASAGVDVVGEAGDVAEARSVIATTEPDVVIFDVCMPPTYTDEGIVAAIDLRRRGSDAGILVVSHDVDAATAQRLLDQCDHGVGYLLKDRLTRVEELVEAIDRVRRGENAVDREVVERLMARRRADDVLARLTSTEQVVLAHMAEGRSNERIAELLVVSKRTVETHVSHIFQKLDLPPSDDHWHRRVLAVIRFLRRLH